MAIRIVTDSTCDLPAELVVEHGITTVPLYINAGGQSYLDGIELSRQEFYERLPGYDPPPTTAAPGPETFCQTYERLADEGASEILSMHISISLSNISDVARLAAQRTSAVPVTVFDSRQLSMGTGFLVLAAATAAAGRSEVGPVEQLALVHTHAAEEAKALWQEARHLFPRITDPLSVEVTPVIGAHIGPGAVGFACVASREA